ncbi:MAG: TauD/TfdA dioxygenase family protein [Parvibaculales bacterium]
MSETFKTINAEKISSAMGAMIDGVDLAGDISDSQFTEIRHALFQFGAIGFRNQKLDLQQQVSFAKRFGSLEVHPIVKGMEDFPEVIKMHKPAGHRASFGVGWHSDNSFFKEPSLGSILYAEKVPPVGGDTLFANQQLAYERLSEGLKETLEGLTAIHSAHDAYTSDTALEKYDTDGPIQYTRSDIITDQTEHPAIISHPVTGKKALYLNPMFTSHFKGWSIEDSRPLLDYLLRYCVREDFQCRFKWEAGTVVIWDNRIVQHAAMDDYPDHERIIYRITVNGEKLR